VEVEQGEGEGRGGEARRIHAGVGCSVLLVVSSLNGRFQC